MGQGRPAGPSGPAPETARDALRADCGRCLALCCVVPAFAASADFAIDKPAGQPCPNLRADCGCSIHDRLRPAGFAGCAVYDCFGAGQRTVQVTFGGRDWRSDPALARSMFAVFPVLRQLHELLWYLTEALALPSARPVHPELRQALDATERLAGQEAGALAGLDVAAHRRRVNELLLRASDLARTAARRRDPGLAGADLRGADLTGRDLRRTDLRAASLRGALLLGARLTGSTLLAADVTGADLRGADLSGADLSGTLFLTQAQLDAAAGDPGTRVPASLIRPAHWAPRPG